MSVPSLDVGEPESAAPEHDELGPADDPEVDQAEEVEPAAAEQESEVEPAAAEQESEVEPAAADQESEVEPAAADQASEVEPAAADQAEEVEPAAAEQESGGPEPGSEDAPLELAAVVAERDAYLDNLQRITAEFTNFRRQTIKRNTEFVAQAASRLAKALLPVLDACEAAVSQGVEGIEAVQAQMLGVLSAEGLTVLGSVDEPFDPGFHEAVMSEDASDDGEAAPVVAEVLRTGYAWNGRVLRPAMVKVRG